MKLNRTKESVADRTRTKNKAGGEAYVPDTPERGLYKVVINNLLEDTHYRSDEDALQDVIERFDPVAGEAFEFALKLAGYAREEMYLRDISQVLLVLAAHDDRTKQYVREYAPTVIQRADEPCTVVAVNDMLFGVPSDVSGSLRDGLDEPVRAIDKLEKARRINAQRLGDEDAPRSATIPKPLKKGINDALHQFDAHQFAKYDRKQREVNIRDVINRTHPKPRDQERDEIFERLMHGDLDRYDAEPLKTPETWETVLSARKTKRFLGTFEVGGPESTMLTQTISTDSGNVAIRQSSKTGVVSAALPPSMNLDRIEVRVAPGHPKPPLVGPTVVGTYDESDITNGAITFGTPMTETQIEVAVYVSHAREAWESVLPRMGIFAKIRNLRNMLEAGVPEETILDHLNLDHVRESKMYPFRFYQAWKALQPDLLNGTRSLDAPKVEQWLSDAVDLTAENLPDELEDTLVAVDLSNSMDQDISENGTISCKEIASFFGAALAQKGAVISAFGSDFDFIRANEDASILELTNTIHETNVGHSTNGWKAVEYLRENNLTVDRIVMLTDEQIWDSTSTSTNHRSIVGSSFTSRARRSSVGDREQHSVRKSFKAYRDEVSPETSIYMIDLSSYGTMSMPEGMPGVYSINGWNSKVLDFIEFAENEDDAIEDVRSFTVGTNAESAGDD